jgi:hypothetical protein
MFQEVEASRREKNWDMKVVRLSALSKGHLYNPRKYPWYSFLLDAVSTSGPKCGRKGYSNKKFL